MDSSLSKCIREKTGNAIDIHLYVNRIFHADSSYAMHISYLMNIVVKEVIVDVVDCDDTQLLWP